MNNIVELTLIFFQLKHWDIAMLMMSEPLEFGPSVQPAEMPNVTWHSQQMLENETCLSVGWSRPDNINRGRNFCEQNYLLKISFFKFHSLLNRYPR